jgi:hypothetical protein
MRIRLLMAAAGTAAAVWIAGTALTARVPIEPLVTIDSPMPPPAWALAQRELLRVNGIGVELYANRFLDARGYMPVEPNWGVSDGPDDITENVRNWPLAHMLGGPDSILTAWERLWEGHLDQFTKAKIPEVPQARDGIFYKEFTTSFDWEHISEGLGPFYFYGLSRPTDLRHHARARRFAGFYMNEDSEAPNYDSHHRIIRSLFNGSRGPQHDPATIEQWDGPAAPGTDPNSPRRTRFRNSSNIRGDHPLNLNVARLVFHAYVLTQDEKYRDWVLEYVDAWRERMQANGGNLPSNIGLDGRIGGEWGGKWYGGVFGWNSPDEGVRNYVFRGPPEAFGAALLLTGDQAYAQALRRQVDNLFEAKRVENGTVLLPRYFGDDGWYGYHPISGGPSGALGNLPNVLVDLYLWSLSPEDLARIPGPDEPRARHHPDPRWIAYLQTGTGDYPLIALQEGLDEVRQLAARLRGEAAAGRGRGGARAPRGGRGSGGPSRGSSGPAQPPLTANPVSTTALINLTMGSSDPGGSTHGPAPLYAQVRHFDPDRRRAGLPEDVAALVQRIEPGSVTLTLVNTSPLYARNLIVQMGAYGEHLATQVEFDGRTVKVDAPYFSVRLAPGAGGTLKIATRRFVNRPTLAFPWDRGWMVRSVGTTSNPGAADGAPTAPRR